MGRRGTEKRPVGLTNKFVAKLTGEEMWWDDDPKATGFGVRSYRGEGQIVLRRLPPQRASASLYNRSLPSLVRRSCA